jgi:hypothetical protein
MPVLPMSVLRALERPLRSSTRLDRLGDSGAIVLLPNSKPPLSIHFQTPSRSRCRERANLRRSSSQWTIVVNRMLELKCTARNITPQCRSGRPPAGVIASSRFCPELQLIQQENLVSSLAIESVIACIADLKFQYPVVLAASQRQHLHLPNPTVNRCTVSQCFAPSPLFERTACAIVDQSGRILWLDNFASVRGTRRRTALVAPCARLS